MTSSKVKPGSKLFPTDPVAATGGAGGAVSSWLSLPHASSVIAGAGDSSVHDILNANPATQSTDGRRPAGETNGGQPCMRFATNDVLVWPLIAANNGTTRTGFAFWFKTDAIGSFQNLIEINTGTGGASGRKLSLFIRNTGPIYADMYSSPTGTSGTTGQGPVLSALTWYFVTLEYDASAATDALKLTITLGGVAQTLAFTPFGAGSLTTLPTVTGNALIGNRVNAGSPDLPFQGLIGPNFWCLGAKQAGAGQGLLTQQGRLALMNYQRPT
jgi:hypothetical protein